jgi:hypothetical protein
MFRWSRVTVGVLVCGVVLAGAGVSFAVHRDRPTEESAALDQLEGKSETTQQRELVVWIENETAVRPPSTSNLEVVPIPAAPAEAGPSSRDSSEHEDLLRLRAAATHDLARLWSPLEEKYQASDSAVREDLIITFVSDHEKDLQAIRSRIESIDSQLDAKGWGTGR